MKGMPPLTEIGTMNSKRINAKIVMIFWELGELLSRDNLTKSLANQEIRRLYREYLKLYVKISRMIPEYDNGKYKGNINCYFYALDLTLPSSDLLDYVYTDLDTLKIKAYDSGINIPLHHNGYKIAIFMENNKRSDYHFVRQNIDGSWSSKIGYEECIVRSDNPIDYLNDNIYGIKTDYELVKTLELVKPSKR